MEKDDKDAIAEKFRARLEVNYRKLPNKKSKNERSEKEVLNQRKEYFKEKYVQNS